MPHHAPFVPGRLGPGHRLAADAGPVGPGPRRRPLGAGGRHRRRHQGADLPGARLPHHPVRCCRRRPDRLHGRHRQGNLGLPPGGWRARGRACRHFPDRRRPPAEQRQPLRREGSDAAVQHRPAEVPAGGADQLREQRLLQLLAADLRLPAAEHRRHRRGHARRQASSQNWYRWVPKAVWGWHKGVPHQGPDSQKLRAQGEAGVPVAQRVYGAGHYLRPHFIEAHGCTDVLIEGVTVRNSPFWTIHPLLSRSVTIRDVTVASQGPNDDGCDPESCDGVLIEGCHFDTKDDCVAIKSGRGRDGLRRAAPSRNIVIRDTRVSRGGGGVAIGSEEAGDVNNVYVDGLTGDDPRLSTGVLIKALSTYGAGTVEQIYMRNVRLAGVQNAVITMTCYYGGVPENGPYRPTFRDISFSGFTTRRSRNALNLHGFPDHPIGPVQVSGCAFGGVSGQGVVAQGVVGLQVTGTTVNGRPAHG